MQKRRVGLIFGGKSAEHEVSLQSAKNVLEAIDHTKYEVVLIGIDKGGHWHINDAADFLLHENDPKHIALKKTAEGIQLLPGEQKYQLQSTNTANLLDQLHVVFPLVHGTLGEDGSMQGMLRMANLPFVGSSVLGSAVCMDKDIAKRLLRDAGLAVANWRTYTRATRHTISFQTLKEELGLPFFIKPANQGSSVGVSKVESEQTFAAAIDEAFRYDHKVLIEEAVVGREIECAVLGNEQPKASILGEIIANGSFYSYDAKYIDETGATLQIPADLSEEVTAQAQIAAIAAFTALNCEGFARVDFFLTPQHKLIINEVNTIPGFTKISMYPKLWEHSGLAYSDLIDSLLQLAIERHQQEAFLHDLQS
ncbi:D-alanyl-alanine synthetase A [Fictibacillus macauensis ZFHKF-1]|uniref:D-alanine--D-alanine ligase n=1 Tax=Fictibacillus macauensis ZFHKF-1 TaxID=1196324 RepID=I8UA24_9BACL|nr:D-alanine--D-alanine ligase [Fictibacillus macauensis]EIT83800.1 D-alanyl-alanine synthetase A [Fictibacillus macauensis ZFHKF-1]